MEFIDQPDLIKEYIDVSVEFLNGYESLLLDLERFLGDEIDTEVLREILSELHTFKGNSGMMGFASLQKFTHALEDIYKALQKGELKLDEHLLEKLLESEKIIRAALSGIAPEKPVDMCIDAEIEAVRNLLDDEGAAAPKNGHSENGSKPKNGNGAAPASKYVEKTSTLKVDFNRLDHLMNLMGELVIHRTRLSRINSKVKSILPDKTLGVEMIDASEQVSRISSELHEAIMKVRMLPIKHVLMRFPRMVRDLARERAKEVELHFEGEETELDKTVIDEIGEPLMHLIRNAVDHGIETSEERAAIGKDPKGAIVVGAKQESSFIIITVEDDGRGIDKKKVLEKAVSQGLISRDEMDITNPLELIFLPGFSTADKVTEVSGRGVGMDVVKKSLSRINGSIDVHSDPGAGTRFTIKLPLTLAIISALMVRVGDEQYSIPLANVVESIKLGAKDIHLINNREVVRVRDRILPLLRLGMVFGLPASADNENYYVVIVQTASGQAGLIVDSLLGQQEVVIKALDDYIGDSMGIAGATILGDGRVALIVDVGGVAESAVRQLRTARLREGKV